MEVIEKRMRERERVILRAKAFAESLEGEFSAFLIGSYARGDFNAWSDADVLLIGRFKGRITERLRGITAPPGFEVIPLTPEEALNAAEKRNPMIIELIERGIKLRDDLEIEGKIRERLKTRG